MKHPAAAALILVLLLTGCSTYRTPGGRTSFADPKICTGDGAAVCSIGAAALVLGAGAIMLKN